MSQVLQDIVNTGMTVLPSGWKRTRGWGKGQLNTLLDPLVRTDKTPGPVARRTEAQISDVYFLALEKRGDDSRRFDHFVHF